MWHHRITSWRHLTSQDDVIMSGSIKVRCQLGKLLSVTWQNILAYDVTSCDVTGWRHEVSWHHRMTSNNDSMAKMTMTYTREVHQCWGVFYLYYRTRSRGENTFGSVRVFVCLFVWVCVCVKALPFELLDLRPSFLRPVSAVEVIDSVPCFRLSVYLHFLPSVSPSALSWPNRLTYGHKISYTHRRKHRNTETWGRFYYLHWKYGYVRGS